MNVVVTPFYLALIILFTTSFIFISFPVHQKTINQCSMILIISTELYNMITLPIVMKSYHSSVKVALDKLSQLMII
ncbi:uncharacterized protein DC041_0000934 [Schistosoma bovis]|uniref:Uncharacterized protein n=1 Tax=Schistosoma bovis TaxID=6184 RepID=A0A430PX85_SCHBO|nr:uncharacterized protein DC041_0000934 [Schistosoma bovis]